MSKFIRIYVFLATVAFAAPLEAQLAPTTPLPDEWRSEWEPGISSISSFYLNAPLGPFSDVIVKAAIGFNADEQAVWISTVYREPNLTDDVAGEKGWHGTSYIPTAVAQRSGVGRRFYVAGYIPRTGQVIVEEWRFHNLTPTKFLGPNPLPGGGGGGNPQTHLNLSYSMRKSLVYLSDAHHPILDMACLAASNELMLLTGNATDRLLRLDIATGTAVTATEGASVPNLSDFSSLHYRVVNDGTPLGTYSALYLRERLHWRYAVTAHHARAQMSEDVHFMQDDDFDGVFDSHSIKTFGMLLADNDFSKNLTIYYDENGVLLE